MYSEITPASRKQVSNRKPSKLKQFLAFIRDDASKQALLQFRAGVISENQMAAITLPYLNRCIHTEWRKFPSLSGKAEPEDHVSQLWILYRRWMVPKYKESEPFSPVVLRLTWRVLLDAAKSHAKTPLLQDDLVEAETLNNELSSLEDRAFSEGEYALISEDAIDAAIAQQKVSSILATLNSTDYSASLSNSEKEEKMQVTTVPGFSPPEKVEVKQAGPIPRRAIATHALSPDQQELSDMLKKLGWSQRDFADALGIDISRLASYLYGKTLSVPAECMKIARDVYQQEMEDGSGRERINKLSARSMQDILTDWAKVAGVEYDNNKDFADILGCSVPTLTRWKNGKSRPSVQSIIKSEKVIVAYAAAEKLRAMRNK